MSDWERLSEGTGLSVQKCEAPVEAVPQQVRATRCGKDAVIVFLPGGYWGLGWRWGADFLCAEHSPRETASPTLTSEQYVDQAGMACPGCGDTRFVEAILDMDVDSTLLGMCCTECKATWDDEMLLTGYANLKLKEQVDGK
jgi:hypothetical protein